MNEQIMKKDRQLVDIILKKTEEIINNNAKFMIERLKVYLYICVDNKHRKEESMMSQAGEPQAQYGASESEQEDRLEAREMFRHMGGEFEMFNDEALDSAFNDLTDIGIIPQEPPKLIAELEDIDEDVDDDID